MKKNKHFLCFMISIIFLIGLSGCEDKLQFVGQSRVVEKSQKKIPKWIKKQPKKDKKYMYFVGKMPAPEVDDRLAYKMAISKIADYINAETQSIFTQKLNFNESLKLTQKQVDDFIKINSKASVSQAELIESFWKKVETLEENQRVKTHYENYVLVRVPLDVITISNKEIN